MEMAMAKAYHQAAEGGAVLVHVDEYLADAAVLVFAGAQIDLVPADDRLLGIACGAASAYRAHVPAPAR